MRSALRARTCATDSLLMTTTTWVRSLARAFNGSLLGEVIWMRAGARVRSIPPAAAVVGAPTEITTEASAPMKEIARADRLTGEDTAVRHGFLCMWIPP